jgi:hypothetical protein
MDFNINELKKIQNEKFENRKKVFIIVLGQCINRVKYINKNSNATECWYNIPKIIVGQPLFNIEKCSEFVLKELNNLGFKTNCITPDNIHISWSLVDTQNTPDTPDNPDTTDTTDTQVDLLYGLNFNFRN